MDKVYIKARAKINLDLDVLKRREDNYHEIKSVFQKISLYDEIYIFKLDGEEFILETNVEEINNRENIIYKAYLKLKEKYKNITGIKVVLNKKIPIQAGLAGGSTDCASFILAMNKLFELHLSKSEMEAIGKSLGADVVPCFYSGAVLAEGIGEKITKVNANFKYYILIIKPSFGRNTKKMFDELDKKNVFNQNKNKGKVIDALINKDIELLGNSLYNVFEMVLPYIEVLEKIKNDFIKNGAKGSSMTGTGSCIFGIFDSKENAKLAFQKLKKKYEVYICRSYNFKGEGLF